MKMKTLMRGWAAVAAVLALCGTLACRADWGQAESPDFVLDTTIPEPAALLLACAALPFWLRRRQR